MASGPVRYKASLYRSLRAVNFSFALFGKVEALSRWRDRLARGLGPESPIMSALDSHSSELQPRNCQWQGGTAKTLCIFHYSIVTASASPMERLKSHRGAGRNPEFRPDAAVFGSYGVGDETAMIATSPSVSPHENDIGTACDQMPRVTPPHHPTRYKMA